MNHFLTQSNNTDTNNIKQKANTPWPSAVSTKIHRSSTNMLKRRHIQKNARLDRQVNRQTTNKQTDMYTEIHVCGLAIIREV